MKTGIVITGTGPILIATTCESFEDPCLVRSLHNKGIRKFIAYEVPVEKVKQAYGRHFSVAMGDLKQTDELRVIDADGHRVFYNFSFELMNKPVYREQGAAEVKAA